VPIEDRGRSSRRGRTTPVTIGFERGEATLLALDSGGGNRPPLGRRRREQKLQELPEAHTEPPRPLIRLKRIYNFCCSMLVYTPFVLYFVTLRGIFTHFPKLTY
jgi:hypothetical protein